MLKRVRESAESYQPKKVKYACEAEAERNSLPRRRYNLKGIDSQTTASR
ncbi:MULTISPECIES: hypothetical protein [unclassified Helicobacter]|nr:MULTISPECIES: hypothetical protein [unclassified Helicobacter]